MAAVALTRHSLANGISDAKVGRIMRHPQAHEDQPWFWTITALEQPPSVYNRGYAASGE